MQTLHRLAGVQEASDPTTQPPALVHSQSNLSTPAPPTKDTDKRASLPLNRRQSHRSLRSARSNNNTSTNQENAYSVPPTPRLPPEHRPRASGETAVSNDDHEEEEEDDDFVWGPSHPCFPHPNSHCAPESSEFAATRVIRVKRDWLATGDLYPQYANLYPEILDPLVSDGEFRVLISSLNSICQRTFSPFTPRAWLDSLLGAFTGYIWEDLGLTGAKKGEKELERFIENWNRDRTREGLEVKMVQLRNTGFMSLDFVMPDPGIDVIDDVEGEGGEQDVREALQAR